MLFSSPKNNQNNHVRESTPEVRMEKTTLNPKHHRSFPFRSLRPKTKQNTRQFTMWNVKRAKTNNAKAKNDSEERDQSEANTENAEKTLNVYEHALECGNGARSFLSFFFAASFLFPSESFPLASFFFSFVVLRSCFRRANFFASSELGALVRLSRVFQVPPPRSVFCAREKKEGAWFTSSLLSSLFIFSLSLSF